MKFRRLVASEIDARVAAVNTNGCSLLLYKDARVDMNILDETVGALNWKRTHQLIGDRLYCTVEVWDAEKQQWIQKQDVGTESYTEKEKGQASDSFKRACFNLGIGRELYTAPFIWISKDKVDITTKNDKSTTYDRFMVEDIGYNEAGVISNLTIKNLGNTYNKRNDIVYQLKAGNEVKLPRGDKAFKSEPKKIREDQIIKILQLSEDVKSITSYYKVTRLEDLTEEQGDVVLKQLQKGAKA